MRKFYLMTAGIALAILLVTAFTRKPAVQTQYFSFYLSRLSDFRKELESIKLIIEQCDLNKEQDRNKIISTINAGREKLKSLDFWLRYLEPTVYKQLNGPLPVEWETEVFEKFEKPYKRDGAGLTLAALYLEEENIQKDSLLHLIQASIKGMETYSADSITENLSAHHHFYLCNRLYLLNLAAIYTTAFECPDTSRVIPELRLLLRSVNEAYENFNQSFPTNSLSAEYLTLYQKAIVFAETQSAQFSAFDHFIFIRDYVNPLYAINQKTILQYRVRTRSFVDYSINKQAESIFSKALYDGQNAKGIFYRINDPEVLAKIDQVGKLLFYDPILSGNNKRSCNSCHKSTEFFADTSRVKSLHFNGKDELPRNAPSLVNVLYNHLVMVDGKHISLQEQTKAVITNPDEMGGNEEEILKKVLSCAEYKKAFTELLAYTPQEEEITLEHVLSAVTIYYGKFSNYTAPFDAAMNREGEVGERVRKGFNLFMSKSQCATCHFVPQFNGVKPPYIGSEFEVLGVPATIKYDRLSDDKGRYEVNPAHETLRAFRTGSIRNARYTAPYMHNGVFKTLPEVVDFYDGGGGVGHGLDVPNQTLASDSLHLSQTEKEWLIEFMDALNERIPFEGPPDFLPKSKIAKLNTRQVGGEY